MPKNSVKPETSEPTNETASSNPRGQNDLTVPYSEKTALGGPIFKIDTYGPMPCRLQLSSKILEGSGLKPRDQVQLIAEEGQIVIRKIGEPSPGLPWAKTSGTTRMLDALMAATREKEAEMKAAREQRYAYQEETEAEDEEPDELSDEQRRQEEL